MAAGRFETYMNNEGMWLGQLLNRAMRETLKVGVHALIANTHMDSGRAAAHWLVIPNRGNVRPGAWKQMKFNPAYSTPPIGKPGDKKSSSGGSEQVIKAVVEREFARSISKSVAGRNPATVFTFRSSVPVFFDDKEGVETGAPDPPIGRDGAIADGAKSYWENAKLEDAKIAARGRMAQKFNAMSIANNFRKNPLR